jgi:hypothetical protein
MELNSNLSFDLILLSCNAFINVFVYRFIGQIKSNEFAKLIYRLNYLVPS